jgi:DNA-binding response OmpR family regulator
LQARLEAILRRSQGKADNQLICAGIVLDVDKQLVTLPTGRSIDLTGKEFRLLRYLMSRPDTFISKSVLSEHVYEEEQLKDSNVIEVYINRLRQYLGKELIVTKRGQGYLIRSSLDEV